MRMDVDKRLLKFLPFYKQLFLQENPSLKGKLTDGMVAEALLKSLRAAGHAKRVKMRDGSVWWESTRGYLKQTKIKE